MKRQILLCLSLALAGLFVLLIGPSVIPASSKTNMTVASNNNDDSESKIRRGFDIAPVPLNLQGKNRALVGLGSYIVNAQGGCNDCHTNPAYLPGHDPFLGEEEQINGPCYLSGGVDFGPFRSRNLTPNSEGLPAGLTFEQFLHVLRTGEDLKTPFNPPFDGGRLQVMPWPVYGKMTDRDIKAVYEYLTTIPSRPRCLTPAP
jgi:hypothetical protein